MTGITGTVITCQPGLIPRHTRPSRPHRRIRTTLSRADRGSRSAGGGFRRCTQFGQLPFKHTRGAGHAGFDLRQQYDGCGTGLHRCIAMADAARRDFRDDRRPRKTARDSEL